MNKEKEYTAQFGIRAVNRLIDQERRKVRRPQVISSGNRAKTLPPTLMASMFLLPYSGSPVSPHHAAPLTATVINAVSKSSVCIAHASSQSSPTGLIRQPWILFRPVHHRRLVTAYERLCEGHSDVVIALPRNCITLASQVRLGIVFVRNSSLHPTCAFLGNIIQLKLRTTDTDIHQHRQETQSIDLYSVVIISGPIIHEYSFIVSSFFHQLFLECDWGFTVTTFDQIELLPDGCVQAENRHSPEGGMPLSKDRHAKSVRRDSCV